MMEDEKRKLIVCIMVLVLGLLSAGTGIGAEVERVKQCVLRRSSSSLLGIIAAVSLAFAHAIISIEAICFYCARVPRQSIVNWILTFIYCGLSWFTFDVAFHSFLTGAVQNIRYHGHSISTCHVMKVKLSAFADSSLALASVCIGLVYYLTLYSANTTSSTAQIIPPNQADVELGQPQLPPPTAHESRSCFRE